MVLKNEDNKSGFICCSREVFADILTYEGDYAYWQSFIMVAAHAKGYEYREVETLFEPRKAGTSFLDGAKTLQVSAESLVDLAVPLERLIVDDAHSANPRRECLQTLHLSRMRTL